MTANIRTAMHEKHHDSLVRYVNDVIAMERDILNAVRAQARDGRLESYPELTIILDQITQGSEERLGIFKEMTEEEGGSLGAALKEGITALTGTLAGLYGKVREQPVSRMVRDDIIALDVAAVSYGMLLTLGLAVGHSNCVRFATRGLDSCAPLIVRLTDLLPSIVADELVMEAPLANPAAVQISAARIREAWRGA